MNKQAILIAALAPILGAAALAGTARAQQVELQSRMGDPLPTLNGPQLAAFAAGRAEFAAVLTITDGLGPIFNETGCSQCHSGPAVGGFATTAVTRFGKKAVGAIPFDPLTSLGGSLLQKSFVGTLDPGCAESVPPEADITVLRQTPHVFGAGLLEALADADIAAHATFPPHPAVSGKVRMVQPVEGGPMRPGRMGWKGGVATVFTFSADASLNELGLTTSFFPMDNAPNGDVSKLGPPLFCDTVMDPEDVGDQRIIHQTAFQLLLAPPPQTPRSGMAGEALFNAVGCNACHIDKWTTGTHPEAVLSSVDIRPFSDFLLHDMGLDRLTGGDGCGDGIVDGIATEREMQTRALWGLGQRLAFLHDGRATGGTFAQNIDAAIQDHGGEAAFSRTAYNALGAADKALLAGFLKSLGRLEFDEDNNNTVDVFDWFFLSTELTGPTPVVPIGPDAHGAVADVDQDLDFDLVDFLAMQRAFTGQ
jgi:cytochrome c551/c552